MSTYKHISLHSDESQVLWLTLHNQDAAANFLHEALLAELKQVLLNLTHTTRAIVFQSGQPDTFMLGLALNKLTELQESGQLQSLLEQGQSLCEHIRTLNIPSISLIDGLCLSFGMELAMACDYCITSDRPQVRLGLPECKLGLLPVMGGAQQVMQRIGVKPALPRLISGQSLAARQAQQTGLTDACVPRESLSETVQNYLQNPTPSSARSQPALSNTLFMRPLIVVQLRTQLQQLGSPEQAPAAYQFIKLWQQTGQRWDENARYTWLQAALKLAQGSQAKNCIHSYQLKNRLRQWGDKSRPGLQHIHIIGSSYNACAIAGFMLQQGIKVSLQDKRREALDQAVHQTQGYLQQQLSNPDELKTLLTALATDQSGEHIAHADLILVVKAASLADSQMVCADLEERARPDAILAIHSTTLNLETISAALLHPERLLGIHFCHPVQQTRIVELSYHAKTDQALLQKAQSYLRTINKLPLVLYNMPGLLVDRVQLHYILQGIRLHQQGVPHTTIDQRARDLGLPLGPLELADQIGLDYCLRLAEALEKAFHTEIPYSLIDRVKTGRLGIKSGTGFYRYRNGNRLKPARVEWEGSIPALQEKLLNAIAEEGAFCLESGLLEDPDLVDAGLLFGANFPVFLGGPLFNQRNKSQSAPQISP